MKRKDKKKIIVFGLAGFKVGGIEKQLVKQMRFFDMQKYEMHLITLFQRENHPNLYNEIPDSVYVHKLSFNTGIDIKNTWVLYKLLKSLKPHLVLSSMVFPNTLFRLLKPFVGYKVIAREHNTYTDKTFRHKFRDHVLSYVSEVIVAVSKTVALFSSKQAHIPIRKFRVIHNGVDIDMINQFKKTADSKVRELYNEFSLRPDTKILLNVARLKPQKNQTLLIDAFSEFVKEHNEHVLFILGAGVDEENLKQKVRDMKLEHKIFLPGYRQDAYTFYAASQFFVLTSRIEGFPNVGIEAMAFGLPMISTKVSGIDEFLKDGWNGYAVDSTTEDVYAKMNILAALNEKEREEYRGHCLKTARRFSIQDNVAKYEKLFDDIIAKK